MSRKLDRLPWLLCLPALFFLCAFVIYPAISALVLSFQEVDPFTGQSLWVGLENYADLWRSESYRQSLGVSFLFMVTTVLPSVLLSLLIAVLLDANPFFRGVLRTLFLLPVSISSAMAAMLWIFIYNPTAGYLNYILDLMGATAPNWLGDPNWALSAVSVATVWKETGFSVIFLLAGLASVPPELREAAKIDGAGPVQRFWHVVLPILSPTLFFVTIVSVIHSFESFGQIHILTGGGPAGTTTTLVYGLYRDAFVNFHTGPASAQSVVLFAVICLATVFQFSLAKKRVHYG